MKKNLTDIFDKAKVEEIEVLLTENVGDIADRIDNKTLRDIKEEVFLRTDFKKYGAKKRSVTKIRKTFAVAAAACLILFVGVGGGAVYAAEVKEYNAAVSFFNDYGLSTEGLSRGEIKAVYKDITTKAFEYSKTAEVIAMSIKDSQVDGYEIMQKMVSPEDVENWWNYRNSNSNSYALKDNYTGYDTDWIMKFDENKGYDVFYKSSIAKYEDGEVVWNVMFDDFSIQGYEEVSDGVIVTGQTDASSNAEVYYAWIMKIDNEGNIKWKNRFDNGFKEEHILVVIENDDGTYATFGEGDSKYFCFNKLDSDGEVIHFNKAKLDGYRVGNTAKLGDGYIMSLAAWASADNQKVVKVDREGNIQEQFAYESDGVYYYIHSLTEYNGKIYLSGYTESMDSSVGTGRGIEPVVKYIYDNNKMDITSEELTPLVKDVYTAILLVCDVDSGVPEEFYSVKGGLGLWFEYDDAGQLVWYMESIMSTFFSPEANSFTIGGTAYVYRYTFDSNGVLVSEEDTGQRALFRR